MENDELASAVVASTWGIAINAAIEMLNGLADKMEAGEIPTPCGICALRGAVNILIDSEEKRGRVINSRILQEAAGHA